MSKKDITVSRETVEERFFKRGLFKKKLPIRDASEAVLDGTTTMQEWEAMQDYVERLMVLRSQALFRARAALNQDNDDSIVMTTNEGKSGTELVFQDASNKKHLFTLPCPCGCREQDWLQWWTKHGYTRNYIARLLAEEGRIKDLYETSG